MFWLMTHISFPIAVSAADDLWTVGAVIIALVAIQCALVAIDTARRAAHAGVQRSRESRLLEARVELARKHRDAEQKQAQAWGGWRKFTVAWRVPESGDVCSFYLKPHDGKALPPFKPGQYLTFRLEIPGQTKPVIRCYSLSDCAHEDYYRVSIRRVGPHRNSAPPGVASCFFHESLCDGEIVDVKAPSGSFYLDLESTFPIVLLAAGIGITPLLSMLNELVKEGRLDREVYLFYGVGNSTEHSFRPHLESLAQLYPKLHLHVCYSRPFDHEVLDVDFHTRGHVTVDLLKKKLPSSNFHYYLCGPPAMMEGLIKDLKDWRVPETQIHSEAFGAPTVRAISAATGNNPPASSVLEASKNAGSIAVQFARTKRSEMWKPGDGTLLEFAERNQIAIVCGCRAGNCGTCTVAIKKGEVSYETEPGFEAEKGSCLTCCCVPKTELILDA
jgi:ferredoxin-NADP reductase